MASSGPTITERQTEAVLGDWPDEPSAVATSLLDQYGPPDDVSSDRLVWYDHGPWKRSVLHRDGVHHEFPVPHEDYLEQVVDYRIPPGRCDALCQFNGSVIVRRTHGELAACCRDEPTNLLTLNLAHEVLSGAKTVEEARGSLTEGFARLDAGGRPERSKGIKFDAPDGDYRDPDQPTLTRDIWQRVEQRID